MKGKSKNSNASRTAMASTKADFRELRTNSSATVQELQEFLSQLRGKNPQEMLGVVASSQLFRATILSLILVTGAIFTFTAVPYFFGGEPPPVAEIPQTAPTTTPPVPDPKITTPDKPVDLAPLGVNDKLTAPPNSNPLEDQGESFLKDLE